jgi:hypothetical protein
MISRMADNPRNPQPLPAATREDMAALVGRLRDGTWPASAVYETYCRMMGEQGRQPVSQGMLGRSMRKACQRSTTKYVDGRNVRAWVIRERFLGWIDPAERSSL